MKAPYTDHPAEAFAFAQLGTAVLLTLAATRPLLRIGRITCATWLASVWLLVLAPELADLSSIAKLSFLPWALVLQLAALIAARRYRLVAAAVPVFAVILWARAVSIDHDWELLCAGLISAGFILGLLCAPWRDVAAPADAPQPRFTLTDRRQDLYLFLLGTLAGAVVAHYVLLGGVDGSDEWSYTYQAGVYAKGHLYGHVPACLPSLRNFWVFWRDDRMFSQYQPGWPLLLAPLVWFGAIWLGGPLSLGLFAMCIGRLARRALRMIHPGDDRGAGQRAAWIAGLALLASNTMLINGGARFPHVVIGALFCAIVETSWVLRDRPERKRAVMPGLLLGLLTGYLALIRIPDAVMLGMGPGVYVVICAIRKKTHWIAIPCALIAAVPPLLFLLWAAHRQVGGWGVLPYMLSQEFYPQPWNVLKFSIPPANLWKWSLPLAWGTYCWWPLCPAIGLAGMMLLARARGTRRAAFTVGISLLFNTVFYGLVALGRGDDFGYGPRYQMMLVVPIALGTAAFADYLFRDLEAKARRLWLLACAVTVCVGFALLGHELFGSAHRLLLQTTIIDRNIAQSDLHDAIVVVGGGTGYPYGALDVTHNYPIELYKPDVIIANPAVPSCLAEEYPDRALYVPVPDGDGRLTFKHVSVSNHH